MTDQKDMNGALFKNDKKGVATRPDYTGSATVNGVALYLSAWIKTSQKTGQKYMSLAFRRRDDAPMTEASLGKAVASGPAAAVPDPDDAIPF